MALEALPAELRILILESIPNARTLRNLVLASPTYYDTYSITRVRTLHEIAQLQFNHVDLIEPLTAIRSNGRYAEVASEKPGIIDLLHRRRTGDDDLTPILCPEQSIQLLSLGRTFDVLIQAFCAHAPCPPGTNPALWQEKVPLRPSTTERARMMRALCRFETYCNLFGGREWVEAPPAQSPPVVGQPSSPKRPSSTWYRNFTVDEMWNLVFGTMPAWEVEEFGSVCALVRNEYARIFADMRREFTRAQPRWRQLRATSHTVDASELYPSDDESSDDFTIYLNHLVSLGPSFLCKVLSQTSREDTWRLIAANSVSGKSSFTDTVAVVREPSPAQQCFATQTDLDGDTLAGLYDVPALDQPSQRWKQHWYGDMSMEGMIFTNQPQPSATPLGAGPSEQQPARTFGYFHGWESGYAIWDN